MCWCQVCSDHLGAQLMPSLMVRVGRLRNSLPLPAHEPLQSFPSPASCSLSPIIVTHGHRQVRSLSPLISFFPLAQASFFHTQWLEQI